MKTKYYILVYSIAISVFLSNLIRFVSYWVSANTIPEFFLGASILVSMAALIIRIFIVDFDEFSAALSNSTRQDTLVNPGRFFNFLPVAMLICTTADFVLRVDFVLGMLTFLVAQILYIRAYSGIIPLYRSKSLFSGKSRSTAMGVTLGWTVITTFIYFRFLFNPDEWITIAIIPYIITLGAMVVITYLLLLHYPERPLSFRLMLVGGGTSFFISDAILAINRFTTPVPVADLWIHPTYLLAVFLLQYSILFLQRGSKEN